MLLCYKIFAVYMSFLIFGVVLNDVSAFLGPGTNPYVGSMHQTSILLVFFGAFLVGTGAMYDIIERRLSLARGTFVYVALMWCSINNVWAIGYYLLMGTLTATAVPEAFSGLDAPFSFGFYTPEVPKYVMMAYNAMNLVASFAIFERKTVWVALAGIFVPVVFVNAYAPPAWQDSNPIAVQLSKELRSQSTALPPSACSEHLTRPVLGSCRRLSSRPSDAWRAFCVGPPQ